MKVHKTTYLTSKQVSKILHIKVQTLNQWRWNKKYKIPYVKFGKKVLYPEHKFQEFLEEHFCRGI